jgi:hypothetical protein
MMEGKSAKDLYFERRLAEIEHRRQWDTEFEGHAVIISLDGGETWEFEGTFGLPVVDTTRKALDIRRRLGRGLGQPVFARSIPYSMLAEYGLDIRDSEIWTGEETEARRGNLDAIAVTIPALSSWPRSPYTGAISLCTDSFASPRRCT